MFGYFKRKQKLQRELDELKQHAAATRLVRDIGDKVDKMLEKAKPGGRRILKTAFKADPGIRDEMVMEIADMIKHDIQLQKYKLPAGIRVYIAEKIIENILKK